MFFAPDNRLLGRYLAEFCSSRLVFFRLTFVKLFCGVGRSMAWLPYINPGCNSCNSPIVRVVVAPRLSPLGCFSLNDSTACMFAGSIRYPSSETMRPRQWTPRLNSLHFLCLSFTPRSRRRLNTTRRCSTCSSNVLLNTITSSRYATQISSRTPSRQFSINLWNSAGTFLSPNGIRTHS